MRQESFKSTEQWRIDEGRAGRGVVNRVCKSTPPLKYLPATLLLRTTTKLIGGKLNGRYRPYRNIGIPILLNKELNYFADLRVAGNAKEYHES